jgi:predicted nucleic acid-binding protein
MPASFFDSDVLLYVASRDPEKASKAEQILAHDGSISVQVLNEVANVARR